DPSNLREVVPQSLKERAAERIPVVGPGVVDKHLVVLVAGEFGADQLYDRGFAGTPLAFKANGPTSIGGPKNVDERLSCTLMPSLEVILLRWLVGQDPDPECPAFLLSILSHRSSRAISDLGHRANMTCKRGRDSPYALTGIRFIAGHQFHRS